MATLKRDAQIMGISTDGTVEELQNRLNQCIKGHRNAPSSNKPTKTTPRGRPRTPEINTTPIRRSSPHARRTLSPAARSVYERASARVENKNNIGREDLNEIKEMILNLYNLVLILEKKFDDYE